MLITFSQNVIITGYVYFFHVLLRTGLVFQVNKGSNVENY